MNELKKWVTVQIWRRKRKKGTTYALRYGDPKRPKTVGLGRCTEEYAELRRAQLEEELNAPPPEAKAAETVSGRVRLLQVTMALRQAGFVEDDVRAILEIVKPHLQR
jgi:hypothetical protein